MRGFLGLTKRNILIYFKDVQSVIFSMLTSIIVFVLYLLFIKMTFVDSINESMKGLENFIKAENVDTLVNAILLTGILGSATITVPYNCLVTIVKDKENKIDYDILATPVKRWQIILSYFTASTICAFLMTSIVFMVGFGMISANGNLYMDGASILATLGVLFLGSVSATAIFMILMIFFKSSSASGAFFGILSAACGFIIGAYMPISQFSKSIQTFCNLFPATGVTVLLRNNLLNGLLDEMNTGIGGVDKGMFTEAIKGSFGFTTELFEKEFTAGQTVLYVCVTAVIGMILMVLLYAKNYKRK